MTTYHPGPLTQAMLEHPDEQVRQMAERYQAVISENKYLRRELAKTKADIEAIKKAIRL